jgi:protein-S-isoprenylcysteine O-methyltransferase Ste14
MAQDTISRIIFAVLFGLLLIVRNIFSIKQHKWMINLKNNREGKINFMIRRFFLGPVLGIFMLIYFINPPWIKFLAIPFPPYGNWIGTFLGLLGIGFLTWVHICLGKEWSADLKLNADHQLIESGPYSRIRHPMYTALITIYFALGIISSNYIILTIFMMIIISVVIRIPEEEKMMIERFGERYKIYMQNTGRILPKF